MLADKTRLDAYQRALQKAVGPEDCVVDIGTGTGILASYAAKRTKNAVYGIEYFSTAAAIGQKLAQDSGYSNLIIVNNSSYNRPIEAAPDILVTETIGPIAPEENIVELCYEFCRRYPSVKTVIPSTLQLFAQPIYSRQLDGITDNLLGAFLSASHDSYDFNGVKELLLSEFCREPQFTVLDDAHTAGESSLLVEYQLGVDKISDFKSSLFIPTASEANAVHLYFYATLFSEIILTNKFSAAPTHWRHCYVKRPPGAEQLDVSYSNKNKKFHIKWRDKHELARLD
ncbi:MAG: 50S ribosomal protein L11 methyltransferase [Deltaproteobacteria bacterium]|nr:50S ribosomal protein L11 methyltransferase [Deltaproteobacteria bacterium]